MLKTLLLLLSAAALCNAQGNPPSQRIFNGPDQKASGITLLASATIQNSGQSVHFFAVSSMDKTGQTCAGYFGAQMNGSYGNGIWFALPQVKLGATGAGFQTESNTNNTRLYQAIGRFPQLRVVMIAYDISKCVYDGYYSSAVTGAPVSPLGTQGYAPLQISGLIQKAAAGDQTLFLVNSGSGFSFTVYGMTICNTTAGQTVQIKVGATVLWELPNMSAGQCFTSAPGQIPIIDAASTILLGGQGSNIVLNLANATNVDIMLQYRFE